MFGDFQAFPIVKNWFIVQLKQPLINRCLRIQVASIRNPMAISYMKFFFDTPIYFENTGFSPSISSIYVSNIPLIPCDTVEKKHSFIGQVLQIPPQQCWAVKLLKEFRWMAKKILEELIRYLIGTSINHWGSMGRF